MKKRFIAICLCFLSIFLCSTISSASFRHLARVATEESLSKLRLMTFDGGGMRGLIALRIAKEVKDRLGWSSLSDGVEWFAGSSTGSIVATGLANGVKCENLEKIYTHEGPSIFHKSWWRSVWSFREELYDDRAFVAALKKHFQDTTVSSLRRDLIVLSNDIEGSNGHAPGPVVFNSGLLDQQEIPLWTIPRSSSSAPTYFKPFYGFEGRSLVDAGTVANMPTDTAISSILGLYDDETYKEIRDRIKIVSIGTGTYDLTIPRDQSRLMGFLDWAPKITPLMMQDATKNQIYNLENQYRDNFVRLDPILDRPIRLDSTDPADLDYMMKVAEDYIQSEYGNDQIERAVRLLEGNVFLSEKLSLMEE